MHAAGVLHICRCKTRIFPACLLPCTPLEAGRALVRVHAASMHCHQRPRQCSHCTAAALKLSESALKHCNMLTWKPAGNLNGSMLIWRSQPLRGRNNQIASDKWFQQLGARPSSALLAPAPWRGSRSSAVPYRAPAAPASRAGRPAAARDSADQLRRRVPRVVSFQLQHHGLGSPRCGWNAGAWDGVAAAWHDGAVPACQRGGTAHMARERGRRCGSR